MNRRNFLQIASLGAGVSLLRSAIGNVRTVHAEVPSSNLILVAYMSGGWDQLAALDPRSNVDPKFQNAAARAAGGTGICPDYDLISDPETRALLAANPSGVQKMGALTFGPAVPLSLQKHFADLAIIRGVAMDTLTHEVGRRYFTTGKFPRGLAASGSSLTSHVANAAGGSKILPNVSISTESYNEGLNSYASGIQVASSNELQTVLRPLGKTLDPNSLSALQAFEEASATCEHDEYDQKRAVTTMKELSKKSRSLVKSDASTLFQFSTTMPGAGVQPLFDAMGIATTADLNGPKGRAAIAAQALRSGLSQAVSVELANGIDDHDSQWETDHIPAVRTGLDALGRLIQVLADSPSKDGGSVWSHTTLLLFSEFARTPLVNQRGGRDHHLYSSALIGGGTGKLRGNKVFGATTDKLMTADTVDPATGAVKAGGVRVRPADIHATLFSALGLDLEPIKNQNPVVLNGLLK
jgi:uncharacterized protein (DUF1501 family)